MRTICLSSASSAAAITTKPGRVVRKAVSKEPACVGPSAPTKLRHGRSGNAPAVPGSPRHARPGRRRAAGTWNRGRRTACSLLPRGLSSESDGMLFGNTDVEAARRKGLGELVEAGTIRHGGGDADDLIVESGFLHQRFGKDAGIARRIRLDPCLGAGDDVELVDAVIFVGRGFPPADSPCPSG